MPTPTFAATNDTLVADHPEGVQGNPAVARLGLGTATVSAWNDLAAGVIRLQVGTPGSPAYLDSDVTLSGGGGRAVGAPAIVGYGTGAFAALWAETAADGSVLVYQQDLAFDTSLGTVVARGPAQGIAGGAHASFATVDLPGGDHAVAVATDAVVLLLTLPDGGGAPVAQALDVAGATNLSMAATGDHGFALAYERAGSSYLLAYDTLTDARSTLAVPGHDPAVAVLTDGRLAVASERDGAIHYGLVSGGAYAEVGTVPSAGHAQAHAAVLGLADGGFVVGWTENAGDPDGRAVTGQRYDASGAPDGEAFALGDAYSATGEDNVAFVDLGKGVFGTVFETDSAYGDDDRSVSASTFTYTIPTKGTDQADVIHGTAAADDILALGGDDKVYGHGGGDRIDGGDGNDLIWGAAPGEASYASEVLHGGAGNDEIHGSDGGSKLYGDAGDDTVYGGAGQDEIYTGTGSDTVFAGGDDDMVHVSLDGKADRLDGGANGYYGDLLAVDLRDAPGAPALDIDGSSGTVTFADGTVATNFERLDVFGSLQADRLVGMDQKDGSYAGDNLRGGAGDDHIDGRAGDDNLDGGAGNDTVLGGSGNDVITMYAGDADVIDGGEGTDKLRINATDADGRTTDIAIVGDLSGPVGTLAGGAHVTGIEQVEVSGSNVADDLKTGDGDDFIRGNGGDDRFSTGGGNDWIDGGAGLDVIDAGAGNDTIVVTGGDGGDRIDGGDGVDLLQLNFYDSKVPLVVDASGDVITLGDGTRAVNIERVEINASNLDDVIRTGASNDVISGRDGNDVIDSGAGNDRVSGGTGDNTIHLGLGDDAATVYIDTGRNEVDGGEGYDTLDVNVLDSSNELRVDAAAGTLGGGGTVKDVEAFNIFGGNGKVDVVLADGADLVYASNLADRIVTNGGNDRIYAAGGDDFIDAGTGSNQVYAGQGDDTILVKGSDYVDGEDGNDLARFAGKWADYAITVSGAGNVTVSGADLTASLRNVERFAFADGEVSLADLTKGPPAGGPVAHDDAPPEFTEDAGTVLGNLTSNDVASTTVTASIVGPGGPVQSLDGTYGTLRVASDNTFSYVPGAAAQALAAGSHVQDVFTYRITDANGLSSEAKLTLSIAGVNDAPVVSASTEVGRGAEDAVVRGQLLGGTDAEGDRLSYAVVTGSVSHGTLSLDAATGAYAFTPDKDWNGTTTFSYTLSDGQTLSQPKTVTVSVDPVNDAPVAATAPEIGHGPQDTVLRGQLLAGSDVDGDVLTYQPVIGSAQHGSVTIDARTGAYAFTPDAGYAGPAAFAYAVSDGSASAAKQVTLTIDAVNHAPTASAQAEAAQGAEDTVIRGRLLAGTDVDGDTLAYAIVDGSARHGSVVVDAVTGAYAFTPDKDYNGPARFSYTVSDGHLSSAAKAVTLTVDPVNDAPVVSAVPESAKGTEDTVLRGRLLQGSDVDGDALSFALVAGSAQHGSVSIDATTGEYAFTPDHDWNGAAGFSYTVSDGHAVSAAKAVTLDLAAVNDAPTASAAPESARGAEDTVLRGQLAAGKDVEGDTLSYALVAGSAHHGSVVVDAATGAYAFTPDHDWNGGADFSYTVSDGSLASAAKLVSLTFEAVNDAPVAAAGAETYHLREDAPFTGRLAAGSDADGDRLTYELVAGSVTHGQATLDAATGDFGFRPDTDFNGAAELRYRVYDGHAYSAEKTVSLLVDPVNDGPVARDDAGFTATAGKAVTILAASLLANDTDADGDRLSLASVSNAKGGTATLDADGNVVFTADAGYAGPASFSYAASDGHGGTGAASVSLTVQSATVPGLPTILGTERTDLIQGTAKAESIDAKGGADIVLAGGGDDLVHGGAGSDILYGDDGRDRLWGDAGDDLLFGGNGDDWLNGGAGNNVLTGGAGKDTFAFDKGTGANVVTDFQVSGGDVLDVSALGFRNLKEVQAAMHEVKVLGVTLATVIDGPGDSSISLTLVKASQLKADDFLFA